MNWTKPWKGENSDGGDIHPPVHEKQKVYIPVTEMYTLRYT